MSHLSTYRLWDPISGEGEMAFEVLDAARVRVSQTDHPDVPADVRTMPIEEAREVYRRAIRAGWVKP